MRFALSVLWILLLGCGSQIVVHKPSAAVHAAQSAAWKQVIYDVAEAGDWFVIRGYKSTDNLVVAATNIPISHAAVYDPEKGQVIEATGKGVGKVPLAKFVDKSHRLIVIRPRWWTQERGHAAVVWARKQVGKAYDFMGTVGMGSSKRWYCSEICVDAYRQFHEARDHLPKVIEPGQMYLWGRILFDSGSRN